MKRPAKYKNRPITLHDLDERVNNLDKRLDNLDERLGNVEKRLDNIEKRLKDMVTKDYLDEKLKNYVTKEYLVGYIDMKFAELDERFVTRTEFREAMDRIYTSLDYMIGILKNQEWEIVKHSMGRHEETLLHHHKRITKLETVFKTNS